MWGKRKPAVTFLRRDKYRSEKSNLKIDSETDDMDFLKKEVKRIEIMSRMENRDKSSFSAYAKPRPNTTANKKAKLAPHDFRTIGKEYHREKSLTKSVLEDKKDKSQIQNGLLGQYRRYQQLSKRQLIQKLISLEQLANTIFKKNKHLQQELAQLKQPWQIQ